MEPAMEAPPTKRYNGSNTPQYLPPDIITDILSRISVRTLLKFRCVCKSWLSLISSFEFAKTHLNFSKKSVNYANNNLILVSSSKDSCPLYACSIESILDSVASLNLTGLYFPSSRPRYPMTIFGNSNGLFCVYVQSKLVLYNTITRKSKTLQGSGTPTERLGLKKLISYGLCYDELNDDYKVVEHTRFPDHNNNGYVTELKIYSLRTDSWRKMGDSFHCSPGIPHRLVYGEVDNAIATTYNAHISTLPGILVGGVLHWVIVHYNSSDHILAVDAVTYTYQTLACPQYENMVGHIYWGVIDFDGCVGAYHIFNRTRVDIWTMKGSWSKVLSVPYYGVDLRCNRLPLVGFKNGEILLDNAQGSFMVYYSRDNSFVNHNIPNLRVLVWVSSLVYIESLVAPSFD